MKHLGILPIIAMFSSLSACLGDNNESSRSEQKVIHGVMEAEYPYVVQIFMERSGMCTGSFVSDSILLTAAHCIDKIQTITWNGISVDRSNFFIHDRWPNISSGCSQARHPKFDLAMIRFPPGSYQGKEYAKILKHPPNNGEAITIVGYGNSHIQPFDTYCTMPSTPQADNRCYVLKGISNQAGGFDYSPVLDFPPEPQTPAESCSAPCTINGLRSALDLFGMPAQEFVLKYCDGNFRDRSYMETGAGVKRSGSNRILRVQNGLIEFKGPISLESEVIDSTSGSGDSGGPLLVFDQGQPRLAGITHGGTLLNHENEISKWSIYVDITAAHSSHWIQETVLLNQLNFPGY